MSSPKGYGLLAPTNILFTKLPVIKSKKKKSDYKLELLELAARLDGFAVNIKWARKLDKTMLELRDDGLLKMERNGSIGNSKSLARKRSNKRTTMFYITDKGLEYLNAPRSKL